MNQPVNPNSNNPTPSTQPATPAQPTSSSGSGWNPQPMTWMGMSFNSKEVKQLWNVISQNIAQQIQAENQKALKALKKLDPANQNNN